MNAVEQYPRIAGCRDGQRSPPSRPGGPLGWLRANLFSSWLSTATTLLLAYLVVRAGIALIEWGIVNAIWSVPDGKTQACRDSKGIGACWAVIAEKYRFILFGTYPYARSGARPVAIALFIFLYLISAWPRLWRKELAMVWLVTLVGIGISCAAASRD